MASFASDRQTGANPVSQVAEGTPPITSPQREKTTMRLCRFEHQGQVHVGVYRDSEVSSLARLGAELKIPLAKPSTDLLDYLPPDGPAAATAKSLAEGWQSLAPAEHARLSLPVGSVKLLYPI